MADLITITRKQWKNDMIRAQADALREAAAAFAQTDPIETALGGMDYPIRWLRARAEEIEAADE